MFKAVYTKRNASDVYIKNNEATNENLNALLDAVFTNTHNLPKDQFCEDLRVAYYEQVDGEWIALSGDNLTATETRFNNEYTG